MPTRRTLLAGLAASGLVPGMSWAALGNPVAVSAARQEDGSFALLGLDRDGAITFAIPLPGRGHAAGAHPHLAEVVAIARRPGTFAMVIDCASGDLRQTIEAPAGRHFYGHGAFSGSGDLLFTTENDIATGDGRIGVWDRTDGYRRIGEFASGGIGPHEILRMPQGTLAVANGGIRTHPDSGREKLNLDSMRPNLTVLSLDGEVIDSAELPDAQRQNSLRHIAVQSDGTLACGFQWQGDPYDVPPLLALYRGDGSLSPVDMPDEMLMGFDGYVGSVSTLGTDGFAASSPRGGRAVVFDTRGTVMAEHLASDVCGLSPRGAENALATDGFGSVFSIGAAGLTPLAKHPVAFDNHLVPVG